MKMKKTLLIVTLLIFSLSLLGRVSADDLGRYPSGKGDAYGFRPHTVGGVWNVESNFGSYGDANAANTGNPSFDYPGGTGIYYQWEGRLWIGTEISGEPYVTHADYGNYEWEPDVGSWTKVGPGVSQWDIVSKFHDYSGSPYNSGRALGLHVTQRSYQWSVPEYADFIAYEYEIVWDPSKADVGGSLDEAKFHIAWVWDSDVCEADPSDPHLDDMVSFDGFTDGEWANFSFKPSPSDKYTVTQTGATEGSDGIPDQWQIYGDDANEQLISSDDVVAIPRNMSYIYDEDNRESPGDDEGENGECPGYIFGRFIYGPPKGDDIYGTDADGNETRYPAVSSHQWWNWNNDPGSDEDKFDYMKATHSMSLGYEFLPTPYDVGASEFDYRFMQTVGPYTLEPLDTLRIVYVSGVGYGLHGGTDDVYGTGERLGTRMVADYALDAYYMGADSSDPIHPSPPNEDEHWKIPVPPKVPELHYSASEGEVSLIWSNIAEKTPDPIKGYIDFEGYRVYRSAWTPGNWKLLDSFTVAQGNIKREYTDATPKPGVPYYYAVTAFDDDGLESGKSNYLKDAGGAQVPLFVSSPLGDGLDSVRVVPNPYYGSASWEAQYEDKIKFLNLPQNCRIQIYTLTGDLIYEVTHKGPSGDETWNLNSMAEIEAASGLYVYKIEQSIEQPDGTMKVENSKVGKLLIMR